jgi:hypothetical protein
MQGSESKPLPRWLVIVGSTALVLHFGAIGMLVLATRSGPWLTPWGGLPADPPTFAQGIGPLATRVYLQPLQMIHNYHFRSNEVETGSVYFEVHLKDEKGELIKTLRFPDARASFWVRQQQEILAQGLGDDRPIQAPRGERTYPPGENPPQVRYWEMPEKGDKMNVAELRRVSENALPKSRPLSGPTEWSFLLAQSYVRYLCREHGAASAELIRHVRDPIWPMWLLASPDQPPPILEGSLEERASSFVEKER